MNEFNEYIKIFKNLDEAFIIFDKKLNIISINNLTKSILRINSKNKTDNLNQIFNKEGIGIIKNKSSIFSNKEKTKFNLKTN